MRKLPAAWMALLAGLSARGAAAQPVDPDGAPEELLACVAAFKQAQIDRDDGRWLAAREQLALCAAPRCPAPMVEKCGTWRDELVASAPALRLRVRDARGAAVMGAVVRIDDGEPRPIGEASIELDPGRHRLTVEHGGRSEQAELEAQPGRQHEVIIVMSTPEPEPQPAPPPAPPAHREARSAELPAPEPRPSAARPPPPALIAMAVGFAVSGAASVAGAVTGGIAAARSDELEPRCNSREGCAQAEIDEALRVAHASTGLFVVAGVTAAAALAACIVWQTEDGPRVEVGAGSLALAWRF